MGYACVMAEKDDAPPDAGMDLRSMKRLLARARRAAIAAAIGQGDPKTGGKGLVLLDHVMPPKQLLKTLKDQFPKASKFCFGRVSVDKGADPKLVTFHMNRRVPGLDRRLRLALRGTGYNKVSIETGKSST